MQKTKLKKNIKKKNPNNKSKKFDWDSYRKFYLRFQASVWFWAITTIGSFVLLILYYDKFTSRFVNFERFYLSGSIILFVFSTLSLIDQKNKIPMLKKENNYTVLAVNLIFYVILLGSSLISLQVPTNLPVKHKTTYYKLEYKCDSGNFNHFVAGYSLECEITIPKNKNISFSSRYDVVNFYGVDEKKSNFRSGVLSKNVNKYLLDFNIEDDDNKLNIVLRDDNNPEIEDVLIIPVGKVYRNVEDYYNAQNLKLGYFVGLFSIAIISVLTGVNTLKNIRKK
ncbi:hypothetical protein JXB41_02000 [Candidatus Woesearchaeota archaeon]|nr:hypothetical protein [Candidatus Woesearchaeota archaeon]